MMYKGLIRYILIVVFLYVLWSIVLGYFSFLLFILALLLFVFSWLVSLTSMKHTTVSIDIEHHILERQQSFYLSFLRQDQSRFRCGQIIIDYHIEDCLGQSVYQSRLTLYDDISMDRIDFKHSGCYWVMIDKIYCFDILQCLFKKNICSCHEQIYVFPKMIPLQINLSQIASFHQESQEYSPYHKGDDYSELFDLRSYHEGDSLKHIHWKASLKKNELFVKEGSQPIIKKLFLTVDLNQNASYNDKSLDTFYSLCLNLLHRQTPFEIICPQTYHQPAKELISNVSHLQTCLKRILKTPNFSYQDVYQKMNGMSLYVVKGDKIEVIEQ